MEMGKVESIRRAPQRGASPSAPPLTPRETEVLYHVAAGLQNKEVAQNLGLSLATVRNHIHSVLVKLGVHSKLEAVSLSFRNGWIPDAERTPAVGQSSPSARAKKG
jgi:DNA-binding NarL/FixJ family response regulator